MIRWMVCVILGTVLLMIWVPGGSALVRTSTNYSISEEVLAGAGNAATSPMYTNTSTLGQPCTVGQQTAPGSENQSGFWHAEYTPLPVPALSAGFLMLLLGALSLILVRKRRTRDTAGD